MTSATAETALDALEARLNHMDGRPPTRDARMAERC